MSYVELKSEKIGVSDKEYEIIELSFSSGDFVKEGDVVATYETSKSLIEVEAPSDGYIFYTTNEEEFIGVGSVIAYLSEKQEFDMPSENRPVETHEAEQTEQASSVKTAREKIVSKSAQLLLEKLENALDNIDAEVVTYKNLFDYICSDILFAPIEHEKMDKRIVIQGAGRFASVIIDAIRMQGEFYPVGIIDDTKPVGFDVDGVKVIGGEAILSDIKSKGINNAVIGFGAIGEQFKRQEAYEKYVELGFNMPNIIHPKASLSRGVELGDGNIILSQVDIGAQVTIGNNCLLNVNSLVSHHCILSDNVQLSPGAILAGSVNVGAHVVMGMGSTTTFGISIGSGVIVNNGAAVFKSVSDNQIIKG
jgi:sugar O-acyltransferase (sialic acid O-acetyltransferase NeuD family)